MDKRVRDRALGYAAKTVFSVAFLAACGSNNEEAGDGSEAAVKGAVSAACKTALPKLEALYPQGDPAWWHMTPNPALVGQEDVATCCKELLGPTEDESGTATFPTGLGTFRNKGCCSADYSVAQDAGADAAVAHPFHGVGLACTPWGPPVPPSMDWTAVA